MKHDTTTNNDPLYQVGFNDGFRVARNEPVPGVTTIGKLSLHRLPSGQLILTDGVASTTVAEAHLEKILRHVFDNRWTPVQIIQKETLVYES